MRGRDLHPFSARVAYIRSHHLASSTEAQFVWHLGCLDRHFNLGTVINIRVTLETYLDAAEALASATETTIARELSRNASFVDTFMLQ